MLFRSTMLPPNPPNQPQTILPPDSPPSVARTELTSTWERLNRLAFPPAGVDLPRRWSFPHLVARFLYYALSISPSERGQLLAPGPSQKKAAIATSIFTNQYAQQKDAACQNLSESFLKLVQLYVVVVALSQPSITSLNALISHHPDSFRSSTSGARPGTICRRTVCQSRTSSHGLIEQPATSQR